MYTVPEVMNVPLICFQSLLGPSVDFNMSIYLLLSYFRFFSEQPLPRLWWRRWILLLSIAVVNLQPFLMSSVALYQKQAAGSPCGSPPVSAALLYFFLTPQLRSMQPSGHQTLCCFSRACFSSLVLPVNHRICR